MIKKTITFTSPTQRKALSTA